MLAIEKVQQRLIPEMGGIVRGGEVKKFFSEDRFSRLELKE